MKFKFLSHTADVKFQAFGNSIEKCFMNAYYALKEIMFEDIKIKPLIKKKIEIRGKDMESLLYNFLEEFLFLLDAESFLAAEIREISIKKYEKDYKLLMTIYGDKADGYNFSNPVKAITYYDMFVKKEKNKYKCQVVVDV